MRRPPNPGANLLCHPSPTSGDYPTLGGDTDALVTTVNAFSIKTGSYKGAAMFVIDRAAMLAGAASPYTVVYSLGVGSMMPVVMQARR